MYALWKEKIRILIEGMNFEIWKVVKNGLFVPAHEVNEVVVNKKEHDWTKEEREKVKRNLKPKTP